MLQSWTLDFKMLHKKNKKPEGFLTKTKKFKDLAEMRCIYHVIYINIDMSIIYPTS